MGEIHMGSVFVWHTKSASIPV